MIIENDINLLLLNIFNNLIFFCKFEFKDKNKILNFHIIHY